MGIEARGGRWYYRVWIDGKEYRRSTGLAATKRNASAAERIAEEKRAELKERKEQIASPRFSDAAAKFICWCRDVEYRRKENTANRIRTSFSSLVAFFGDRLVREIKPGDVEDYKAWRVSEHGVRDITIRHDLCNLSLFFKRYALKHRWCETNPVDDVTKPSDADAIRTHIVTGEEEGAYFAAASLKQNLYDVARLILLQGCRPEEIMSLEQTDIDLESAQMRIRGGKSRAARRTLDLVGESLSIFRRRLATPDRWVFPSPRYSGHHIAKLNHQHDEVCRAAGVSFVMYDLRHTFATRLAESGCDLPTLAAILGHSSLRMVMRYVHPTAQHRKAAMERYEASLRPRLKVVGE